MTDYRTRLVEVVHGKPLARVYCLSDATLIADLGQLLSEADRLRALVDEAGKVGLEAIRAFEAIELLGHELADCLPEERSAAERELKRERKNLAAARSLLTKLKGEGQ